VACTPSLRDVPGTQNQHIIVAERSQRIADFQVMPGTKVGLDRDLSDWDIGIREHVGQRHPSAVI